MEKEVEEILFEKYNLKKMNTWRIGGNAKYYAEPKSINELKKLLEYAKLNNVNIFVLGKGSNVLIDDAGFEGMVINLSKHFNDFYIYKELEYINVEAGVLLPSLAIKLSRENIDGYDFLTGIPGTLGGAITMNAGCIGKEIADYLISVTYVTLEGTIFEKSIKDIQYSFRFSEFLKGRKIIISCKLKYSLGESVEDCLGKTKKAIEIRKSKFPTNVATAGSTFKSAPHGPYPGELIEKVGLKGYKIGGAMISENHGNWIINTGNATSQDVKDLINIIKEKVYKETNIQLETEVVIL